MHRCGIARSVTYNKLGSLQGWGLNWMKAAPKIRAVCPPESLGMDKCKKVWEWSVNDCMKAISAASLAAKTFIIRAIYQRTQRQTRGCIVNLDPSINVVIPINVIKLSIKVQDTPASG